MQDLAKREQLRLFVDSYIGAQVNNACIPDSSIINSEVGGHLLSFGISEEALPKVIEAIKHRINQGLERNRPREDVEYAQLLKIFGEGPPPIIIASEQQKRFGGGDEPTGILDLQDPEFQAELVMVRRASTGQAVHDFSNELATVIDELPLFGDEADDALPTQMENREEVLNQAEHTPLPLAVPYLMDPSTEAAGEEEEVGSSARTEGGEDKLDQEWKREGEQLYPAPPAAEPPPIFDIVERSRRPRRQRGRWAIAAFAALALLALIWSATRMSMPVASPAPAAASTTPVAPHPQVEALRTAPPPTAVEPAPAPSEPTTRRRHRRRHVDTNL